MKRIFVAVPLVLLAFAAPASAHGAKHRGGHHATSLRAKLAPSGAGSAVAGRARLVDGKKRDKLALHVRGLDAGSTYTWELRSAAAGADACTGDAVDGFTLRGLRVHRHGHADAAGRSKGFSADAASSYAIVVLDADGNVVACAPLGAKGSHGDAKAKHGDDPAAGDDDQQGQDDSQGEDDSQGDDDSQGADDSPESDTPDPSDEPDSSDDD
jgi:cobalamin biosynthesis protein CobT